MPDEPSWEDILLPKAEPVEPANTAFPPPLPPAAPQQPVADPLWQQPAVPQQPDRGSGLNPGSSLPPSRPPAAPAAWPGAPARSSPPHPAVPPPQQSRRPGPIRRLRLRRPARPHRTPLQRRRIRSPRSSRRPIRLRRTPSAPEPIAAPVQPPAPTEPEDPFAALFGSVPTPASPVSIPPAAPVAGPTAPDPAAGAHDDPFAALLATSAPVATVTAPGGSRREIRDGSGGGRRGHGADGTGAGGNGRPKRKRNLLWLKITLPIVLLLGAAGGIAAFGWFNYNEQVRELLGIPLPTDYEGTGNGEEIVVTIRSGDIGSDVANTLHTAGVTMTFDAVYDYLVENPDIGFTPGNWALEGEMSAESAVAALQDPANKVTSRLLIVEGSVLPDVLEIIASTTGIALADVQAAAADPTRYGVPAEAPSLEGYLFPATYELDGAETAEAIIRMLVDETFARLDAAGVAPEDRHAVLTLASIIQREAGSNVGRLLQGRRGCSRTASSRACNLESDATVAYGTGNLPHRVDHGRRARRREQPLQHLRESRPADRADRGAGDDAIDAALHPADGPWLFFVTDRPRDRRDGVLGDRRGARGGRRPALRVVRGERRERLVL